MRLKSSEIWCYRTQAFGTEFQREALTFETPPRTYCNVAAPRIYQKYKLVLTALKTVRENRIFVQHIIQILLLFAHYQIVLGFAAYLLLFNLLFSYFTSKFSYYFVIYHLVTLRFFLSSYFQ